MKVLITGGAGFIGFHLAKYLADKDNEVTLIDNLFRGKMDNCMEELLNKKNVRYMETDLINGLSDTLKNYNHVYHLAAINGTKYFYEIPHIVLKTNVLSTINILDWFIKSNSEKILFSSSSETYAGTMRKFGLQIPTPEDVPLCIEDIKNPRWSYGGTKILGELLFINYARQNKFNMSIARYHNIYGPRMWYEHVIPQFLYRAYKKEDPFQINGNDSRAFCFIDDAVKATELVMQKDLCNNEIINIGNDLELITMEGLAKKIFKVLSINPKIEIKPSLQGSVNIRCPDITKLKKLTNYKPEVSLEEGLEQIHKYYYQKFNEGDVNYR